METEIETETETEAYVQTETETKTYVQIEIDWSMRTDSCTCDRWPLPSSIGVWARGGDSLRNAESVAAYGRVVLRGHEGTDIVRRFTGRDKQSPSGSIANTAVTGTPQTSRKFPRRSSSESCQLWL